ncbi:MAG: ATP-binding protein [Burkholderiales bacterium]|nr:ATP-binding protein [Phycisphaerae bacterium]
MAHLQVHIRLLSDPAQIAAVRKSVESFAARLGFDETAIGEIGLCVNEAIANVIRHAYAEVHDKPIDFVASEVPGGIEIDIRDWGTGIVPPLSRQKPAGELLEPGGLGMPCLMNLMDDIRYVPQSDGMLLQMSKRRR